MLGWEYPPRFAGGLGKACQGLSQALAKQEVQVYFVLPSFPERVSEKHLEVVGAVECLIEAGWLPEHEMLASSAQQQREQKQQPGGAGAGIGIGTGAAARGQGANQT